MKSDPSLTIVRPCLYLVATPIGNLGDFTHRAVTILRGVDLICAEDTRTSQRLLDHYAIENALESLHDSNEEVRVARILHRVISGPMAVAVISDAGTPLVSDPGYRLAKAMHVAGIPVRSIPGPSALLAGLTISGLAVDRFSFEGFLPTRRMGRIARLKELIDEPRSMVFFEAPHRIRETVDDMVVVFSPLRAAFVGRELTKKFETHYRGTLREIADAIATDPNAIRGEFVIVVEGSAVARIDKTLAARLLRELTGHVSRRDAVEIVAAATELPRNVVYELVVKLGLPSDQQET
ncbi:MAG: 16S rRNA (cytidine(1402)-2'-O)-methyltransferase [Gammaproteobacteria bacterium]|nr:16S rRNA (cytidine(1402)-2'-O)-methyltransferase [Gammaproteobacteria bacterium]